MRLDGRGVAVERGVGGRDAGGRECLCHYLARPALARTRPEESSLSAELSALSGDLHDLGASGASADDLSCLADAVALSQAALDTRLGDISANTDLIADDADEIGSVSGADRQETFRVASDGFSRSSSDGRDDGGRGQDYRLWYQHQGAGTVYYLPDSNGFREYTYTDDSRLEEQPQTGVATLPAGSYSVKLQYDANGGGTYSWDSGYGEKVHTAW